MTAQRNQEAWDALRREREEAIGKTEALAAQVEVMRNALHKLACLGNGDAYGNSTGNRIAQEALALPNTADILRKRDAQTKAEMLRMLADGQDAFDEGTGLLPFQMRKMAEELEESNG